MFVALIPFCGNAGAKQKNILLICVDDLRPELASFGKSYIHSPNIDRLAGMGRPFFHHYANAPSCGPSRCTLLTGRYGGPSNDALLDRAKQLEKTPEAVSPSMPEWFRTHGYTTVSVGKVSHHPGGWGGEDWSDRTELEIPNAWDATYMPYAEWGSALGAMHGLANGEAKAISKTDKKKKMDVFQTVDGPDSIYPDGRIVPEGIRQLESLAAQSRSTGSGHGKPFFLVIGMLKPHLPFGAPKKYMDLYEGVELPPIPHPVKPEGITTWHRSSEFNGYNRWGKDARQDPEFADEVRRHYAACVSYSDHHIGQILAALKESGADKDTIVILWGDHGWHLGEHAIWGKHSLFEESLHSPLIVVYPEIPQPGTATKAVVAAVDIFPTLCDLSGVPKPDFIQGESLLPMIEDPLASGHPVFAYFKQGKTVRTDTHRLVLHKDGFVELYDHRTPESETVNIADDEPELVDQLKSLIAGMK